MSLSDRAWDEGAQWTDAGRERYSNQEPTRARRDRRKKTIKPVYSDD